MTLRSTLLVYAFLLTSTFAFAQCSYLNNQFGSANAPTEAGVEAILGTCIFGGEFERINNMEEGLEYRLSTCGDIDFDTELTLFAAGGAGGSLGYNNDACGVQSILNYTPTADGSYDLQVNQVSCGTNTICMTLKIMLLTSCRMECPADVTVQTMNPAGATVNYVVTELPVTNTCTPTADDSDEESGDLFPVGTTLVELTDATGGTVTCSFNVTVDLVLPVEYLYFRGTPTQRGNLLEWATASETENSGFTIQRSIDAWDWKDIHEVEGQGNSSFETRYEFMDEQVPVGEEVYYRIQQTDFDGTINFTDIIALSGASKVPVVDVFPNPVRSDFTVSLEGFVVNESATISLFSISNQEILNVSINGDGNYDLEIPEGTPPGIYILEAVSTEHKVVKQIIIY